MRYKKIFILFGVLFFFVFSFILISSGDFSSVELVQGKNYVKLNASQPFYVKTLLKLNPAVEVVSYKKGNTTVGYVNVFGGIGENFIMQDEEYEIIAKENLTLMLPYQ